MSRLEKLTAFGATYTTDADSGQPVLDVSSQHLLTRAAGYLKYADRSNGPVVFRGQPRLYGSLTPTLYRGIGRMGGKVKRDASYNMLAAQVRKAGALILSTPDYAIEPLLQHYGIHTRWLDLIDNVWIALWFACHRAVTIGSKSEYLHFEKRSSHNDTNPYAYILLIQTGTLLSDAKKPGLNVSNRARLIDLRVAVPSLYLRPHAQHALLMRRHEINSVADMNLQDFVVGVIRVDLESALQWLGQGDLLSTHSLFPPPTYDEGYRRLLNVSYLGGVDTGAITHIGA